MPSGSIFRFPAYQKKVKDLKGDAPMKTSEELNVLKEEAENLNKEIEELNEEKLGQVSGGSIGRMDNVFEGSAAVSLEKEMNHIIR